ncbi:MAG: hypothetical protein OXI26_09735 [bacterium]|nr:hypothetical protein [bacterium]
MDAAPVLGALPETFATSQYREAAGVAASSASRALRRLAERGHLHRMGHGWWQQPAPTSPPPATRDTSPGLWAPEVERVLDGLFGPRGRRLGYLSGLSAAGIPLTFPLTVATTSRPGARVRSAGMVHVRESDDVLAVGARWFTERTAVSTPDRALLECAQYPASAPRCEEYIGYAICWGGDTFAAAGVQALAARLGWRAGLRRIASVAAGLAETAPAGDLLVRPAEEWSELDAAPGRGDRWIDLTSRPAARYPGGWTDQARRVAWWTTPDALANQIAG